MNTRRFVLALAIAAGSMLAPSAFAAPTDAEVEAIVTKYQEGMKAAGQDAAARKENAKQASDAINALAVNELSFAQIKALQKARVLMVAPDKQGEVYERLGVLAKEGTPEGAEAALMRVEFVPRPGRGEGAMEKFMQSRHDELVNASKHPALQGEMPSAAAESFLSAVSRMQPEQLVGSPLWDAVDRAAGAQLSPQGAANAGGIIAIAADPDAKLERAKIESIRAKLATSVAAAKSKLGSDEKDQALAKYLDGTLKTLNGAFAKGTLVGNKAPALTFAWSSDEAHPIKSLDDLKGKVVVLDFWATWCGPCIGSFPKIRELQAHYQGYPVAIVGVTSIQGNHYKQTLEPGSKREKIDCAGDPAKEMALMKDFIKDMNMTWNVAFSNEEVFNPEYGIRGIPHVVILDPDGKVRHRGLHPSIDAEKEHTFIDELLAEYKLPGPGAAGGAKTEKSGG